MRPSKRIVPAQKPEIRPEERAQARRPRRIAGGIFEADHPWQFGQACDCFIREPARRSRRHVIEEERLCARRLGIRSLVVNWTTPGTTSLARTLRKVLVLLCKPERTRITAQPYDGPEEEPKDFHLCVMVWWALWSRMRGRAE